MSDEVKDCGIIYPCNWQEMMTDWLEKKVELSFQSTLRKVVHAETAFKRKPLILVVYPEGYLSNEPECQLQIEETIFFDVDEGDLTRNEELAEIFNSAEGLILSGDSVIPENEILEGLSPERKEQLFLRLKEIHRLAIMHKKPIALAFLN